jgi:hypothetical protein
MTDEDMGLAVASCDNLSGHVFVAGVIEYWYLLESDIGGLSIKFLQRFP